jgi:hypothetical protein
MWECLFIISKYERTLDIKELKEYEWILASEYIKYLMLLEYGCTELNLVLVRH